MEKKYAEDRLAGAKLRLNEHMARRNGIQKINMEEYQVFYDLWGIYKTLNVLKEMDEEDHYYDCWHENVIDFQSPNELQKEIVMAQDKIIKAHDSIRKYKKELGEIKITEKGANDKKLSEISEKTGVSISDVKKILKEAK